MTHGSLAMRYDVVHDGEILSRGGFAREMSITPPLSTGARVRGAVLGMGLAIRTLRTTHWGTGRDVPERWPPPLIDFPHFPMVPEPVLRTSSSELVWPICLWRWCVFHTRGKAMDDSVIVGRCGLNFAAHAAPFGIVDSERLGMDL